jgi:hypothetical protein
LKMEREERIDYPLIRGKRRILNRENAEKLVIASLIAAPMVFFVFVSANVPTDAFSIAVGNATNIFIMKLFSEEGYPFWTILTVFLLLKLLSKKK